MEHRGLTRLAPSPTGALHLGNARTFLINWAIAKQAQLDIVLRMDDLEGPRVKQGAAEQAIEDLRWLGVDWSRELERPTRRLARYEEALQALAKAGRVFACDCSRSMTIANSARTARDGSAVYSGRCRGNVASVATAGAASSLRLRVDGEAAVCDWLGRVELIPSKSIGDFVIRRADGTFSYQLASAVDDLDAGVTHIVRGEDLQDSSARQTFLRSGLASGRPAIRHLHLPLIVGSDGRKLAKRHGDTRLAELRRAGWTAGRVRSLLAEWSGIEGLPHDASPEEWARRFRLDRLPPEPVMFNPIDHGL